MLKEAVGIERIFIRTGKTDLRLGIDRLASIIQVEYGLDPLEEGSMFLFAGVKRTGLKDFFTKIVDTCCSPRDLQMGNSCGREMFRRQEKCNTNS